MLHIRNKFRVTPTGGLRNSHCFIIIAGQPSVPICIILNKEKDKPLDRLLFLAAVLRFG